MSLGEKISSLRKRKGMSQELLAERSNLSLRTVQRIESGTNAPRPYTLSIIAVALDVPVEELGSEPTDQTKGEIHALRIINLSALSAIVIPGIHILVVLLAWRRFNAIREVHPAGKKIVSFQILWTIATLLLVIVVPLIQRATIQSFVIGHFPPTMLIVYGVMLLTNLGLTIHTAVQLQKEHLQIYSFIPALF